MIRTLRPAAAALAASGAVMALSLAAAGTAAAATAPGSARPDVACAASFPIVVDGFAFTPAGVLPGGSSTADLITTNCSTETVATTETWTGQWLPLDAAGNPPVGCPVIDPIVRSVTYSSGEEVAENETYGVPTGCRAAELEITVRISVPAGTAGITTTAILTIIQIGA
jgi:hypothetical protein